MGYWEEQQMKQQGYFEETPKATPSGGGDSSQLALESTLQEVKKTLWNMERHTDQTQSRLEQNNKSGVGWWVKFQTTEYLEAMRDQLGGIESYLQDIAKNEGKTRKLLGQAFFGKKARAKELTPEAKLEESTATKKATKIEEDQSSLLAQINENVIKSITENSMFKWLKENWIKLLAGAAVLTLDYKYWDMIGGWMRAFWKQPIWLQIAEVAGAYLSVKALETTLLNLPGLIKDALITGIAIKWAEASGFLPKGLGGTIISGANLLVIAALIGKMIFDGFKGYQKDWDASGMSKAIGGALAGTGKGSWVNAAMRGAGGAYLGFKIGMFTPFGIYGAIAGMIIGGTIGAIAGFFGGEKVSKWLDGVGKAISTAWNDMGDWFTKKKSNYDTWAQDFGSRMAKASDEWMSNVFNNVWGWMKSIWDFGKSVVNDPKGSFKKFKAGFTNAKKHSGPGAGKVKERLDSSGETSEQRLTRLRKEQADGAIRLEKTAPKTIIDGAETPSFLPTGQILLDDKRTNMSGWSGLSGQAKLNSQRMANMFGGLRITSGQRSQGQQAKAMMGMKSVDVYSSKWKGKLTKAERTSAPGTTERGMAIAKIMAAGYESNHKHGNAIDFSTPSAYIGRIPALRALLEDAFPGSKLIEEGDHMHLAFKPGVAPDQISAGMNKLHDERGGFAGAPSNFNVTHANKTVINSQPSSTVIAGDSIRKDITK